VVAVVVSLLLLLLLWKAIVVSWEHSIWDADNFDTTTQSSYHDEI
jgi:hypothetical protein